MNKMIFIEGTPGVGKTTVVRQFMSEKPGPSKMKLIYSGMVIPENPVRKEIKKGRTLTLEKARIIYRKQSWTVYQKEHLRRWMDLCQNNNEGDTDLIVDAGLIQAPMYEMMGLFQLPRETILEHIKCILTVVEKYFQPHLIYLVSSDPAACIRKALQKQSEERETWVSGFLRWLQIAPYPMERGYVGQKGIEQFIEDRFEVDRYLYDNLNIKKERYYRNII